MFIPGFWGWFGIQRWINIIYHNNKLKKKNHIITAIDAKHLRKFNSQEAIWGVPRSLHCEARQMLAPEGRPTSECLERVSVTLFGKKVFAEVIRLRILRWGDYPGLSLWALNAITSGLIRERQEITCVHTGKGDVKPEQRKMGPHQPSEAGKSKEQFLA